MSSMSGSHWWNPFCKEVKSWDFTTRFRICQFQTPAWKQFLKMHLLAERFVFWAWWSGFPEGGSHGPFNDTIVPSKLAYSLSVFTSIVYGSCWRLS
jgi:hypothetical protein